VEGAWAVLVSRYSREDDVVFGATVSGRPADLPGAESMLGLFINTLPVRVRVDSDAPLDCWLRSLHASKAELRQYEYCRLVDVQGWSGVPHTVPLFESILVFENYPVDEAVRRKMSDLAEDEVRHTSRTNYPLTLVVSPSREVGIEIAFDTARFDGAVIGRMLGHLAALLEGMAANPGARLRDLPLLTPAERKQLLAWSSNQSDRPSGGCIHEVKRGSNGSRMPKPWRAQPGG
jgi:non-ribosomal peptide synthetase component F